MVVKRHYYSFANAASELCFALAAFACGLFDAPVWLTALAAISMLAYWTLTRNSVLNRLRGAIRNPGAASTSFVPGFRVQCSALARNDEP
jgi:hypothetical protein